MSMKEWRLERYRHRHLSNPLVLTSRSYFAYPGLGLFILTGHGCSNMPKGTCIKDKSLEEIQLKDR